MNAYENFFCLAPHAKARPRVTKHGTYMPEAYTKWRKSFCLLSNPPKEPIPGSVQVGIHIQTESGRMRPDLDNAAGAILDALQDAGVIENDKMVSGLHASIKKSDRPGIWVTVSMADQ